MSDGIDNPSTPIPPEAAVGRLNTLGGVRRELARLYRDLRHGRIPPRVAGTAGYLLTSIGKVIEVELFERRLTALEDTVSAQGLADSGASGRGVYGQH